MDGPRTRVRLRVSPGSRRAGIAGRYDDGWKVRVTAPAEGGRANEAIVRLLAEAVELPPASVRLVSGHGSRVKVVELAGLTPEQADRRLAREDGR